MMIYRIYFLGLGVSFFLLSCAPTVNIATPEPVTIDVNIKADITTRSEGGAEDKEPSQVVAAMDRRERMAEVQNLKNDRVVGESREGYLSIVKLPEEANYAAYARRIVDDENKDRAIIYAKNAEKKGQPLELIQTEYAKLWRERSFPGEWVQLDNGKWVQKATES